MLPFRRFIPDVANQGRIVQTLRFYPKVFPCLFSFPFCVDDDGIDQFENVFLRVDVAKGIVVHAAFEIDRIQYPDVIAVAFEHRATFGEDGSFWIGHHIAGMHLHQIGLDEETGFA